MNSVPVQTLFKCDVGTHSIKSSTDDSPTEKC